MAPVPQIKINLHHTVHYERSPNSGFPSFLTLCFDFKWIAYFFFLLFIGEWTGKCVPIRYFTVYIVILSSISYVLSCLQLLEISSLKGKQKYVFTWFYVSILFFQLKLLIFICYSNLWHYYLSCISSHEHQGDRDYPWTEFY